MKSRAGDPEDRAFLASYDASVFERPSVTVDVVLLGIARGSLVVLLVRRAARPFLGRLALPGVFLRPDESLDAAAARALAEKAGLRDVFLEQLYTFGTIDRDPRTRVVSVAYYALVDATRFAAAVGARAATVGRVREGPAESFALEDEAEKPIATAFDHDEIVGTAVRRIRGKLDYAPIGYELLPERFTLLQLQRVHEIVVGRGLNKDSFRRRILASGLVVPTTDVERDVGHRPATLYRYASRRPSDS